MKVAGAIVRRKRGREALPPGGAKAEKARVTTSPYFDEVKGSIGPEVDAAVPPHTLLLGTQPSDMSLAHGKYYMSNANAFWHIVGDALGFRRGFHAGRRTEAVDSIRPHLLHVVTLDYEAAVRRLTARGYALWDMIAASTRPGSLDSAIKDATFADVPKLVDASPSIRRICFATGHGSATRFRRAHAEWLRAVPGRFHPRDDDRSRAVFASFLSHHDEMITGPVTHHYYDQGGGGGGGPPPAEALRTTTIELCVLESVSPASNPRETWAPEKQRAKGFDDAWTRRPAALYPFKRHRWFEACFADEPHVKAAPNHDNNGATTPDTNEGHRAPSGPITTFRGRVRIPPPVAAG